MWFVWCHMGSDKSTIRKTLTALVAGPQVTAITTSISNAFSDDSSFCFDELAKRTTKSTAKYFPDNLIKATTAAFFNEALKNTTALKAEFSAAEQNDKTFLQMLDSSQHKPEITSVLSVSERLRYHFAYLHVKAQYPAQKTDYLFESLMKKQILRDSEQALNEKLTKVQFKSTAELIKTIKKKMSSSDSIEQKIRDLRQLSEFVDRVLSENQQIPQAIPNDHKYQHIFKRYVAEVDSHNFDAELQATRAALETKFYKPKAAQFQKIQRTCRNCFILYDSKLHHINTDGVCREILQSWVKSTKTLEQSSNYGEVLEYSESEMRQLLGDQFPDDPNLQLANDIVTNVIKGRQYALRTFLQSVRGVSPPLSVFYRPFTTPLQDLQSKRKLTLDFSESKLKFNQAAEKISSSKAAIWNIQSKEYIEALKMARLIGCSELMLNRHVMRKECELAVWLKPPTAADLQGKGRNTYILVNKDPKALYFVDRSNDEPVITLVKSKDPTYYNTLSAKIPKPHNKIIVNQELAHEITKNTSHVGLKTTIYSQNIDQYEYNEASNRLTYVLEQRRRLGNENLEQSQRTMDLAYYQTKALGLDEYNALKNWESQRDTEPPITLQKGVIYYYDDGKDITCTAIDPQGKLVSTSKIPRSSLGNALTLETILPITAQHGLTLKPVQVPRSFLEHCAESQHYLQQMSDPSSAIYGVFPQEKRLRLLNMMTACAMDPNSRESQHYLATSHKLYFIDSAQDGKTLFNNLEAGNAPNCFFLDCRNQAHPQLYLFYNDNGGYKIRPVGLDRNLLGGRPEETLLAKRDAANSEAIDLSSSDVYHLITKQTHGDQAIKMDTAQEILEELIDEQLSSKKVVLKAMMALLLLGIGFAIIFPPVAIPVMAIIVIKIGSLFAAGLMIWGGLEFGYSAVVKNEWMQPGVLQLKEKLAELDELRKPINEEPGEEVGVSPGSILPTDDNLTSNPNP